MSQARPKPWESASASASTVSTTGTGIPTVFNSANSNDSNAIDTTTATPSVPPIPSSIANNTNSTSTSANNANITSQYGNASGIGGYGSTYGGSYGGSYGGLGGYSSYGGINGYGNTYGGLGGYNSYGGYGNLGGFGRYGSSYGGMGGYGMGMNGIGMNGMGMNGVGGAGGLNGVADATSRTFQVLENVVYAVSAVAALLESTYYATHNSFFTILGVADQLSQLGGIGGAIKDTFNHATDSAKLITDVSKNSSNGSNSGPLGLYAILAWLKRILRRLLGLSPESGNSTISGSHTLIQEFSQWKSKLQSGTSSNKKANKLSLKPLFVFLVALIGLPVLMSKFVRYIEKEQVKRISASGNHNANQNPATGHTINQNNGNNAPGKVDPRSLEFARAMYDYIPEREDAQLDDWKELKLSRGDLIAILTKIDGWSYCRARDGRIGYVPTNYLEVIKRAEKSVNSTPSELKPEIATSDKE
jgi:peroxin-13